MCERSICVRHAERARRFHRLCVAVAGLVALLAARADAQTQPVTIAWDASPDPAVNGYVVYVGTERDAPQETFEVNGTSFVYPNAVNGRTYFFSVAAYSGEHRTGSRSAEVLFLGGGQTLAVSSNRAVQAAPAHDENRAAAVNADESRSRSIGSIGDLGQVDTLKTLGDGRLILIENGARILILNLERGDAQISAVSPRERVRFMHIAVDPDFATTHVVYVAEAETSADGATKHVDIARYREVNGTLGERAVVVSDLPVSRDGKVVIALDAAGHLFVALPGANGDRADSYAGMVLRFDSDGSLPEDNQAFSPLFAGGVSQPAELEWEPATNSLWVADARPPVVTSVRRVDPEHQSVNAHGVTHGFIVAGQPGQVFAITEDDSGVLRTTPLPDMSLEGEPTAVAQNDGELDVAVRLDVNSEMRTRIVRLRSLPSGR